MSANFSTAIRLGGEKKPAKSGLFYTKALEKI
jgi:hypothetical protein